MERLCSLGRVILWDKRGTGLSDRVAAERPPHPRGADGRPAGGDGRRGQRTRGAARDLRGDRAEQPVRRHLSGAHRGPGAVRRRAALGAGRRLPVRPARRRAERFAREVCDSWGDNAWMLKLWAPSIADDPEAQERWNEMLVHGASPAAAEAWLRMVRETDIRAVLPAVDVPTLVMHRADDRILPVEQRPRAGPRDPRRPLRRAPGDDHLPWAGATEGQDILDEVESFLGRAPAAARARAGAGHRDVHRHRRLDAQGRRAGRPPLARPGGQPRPRRPRASSSATAARRSRRSGDGFLATFDGPGRAIRCARAAQAEVAAARPGDARRPAHRRAARSSTPTSAASR